MGSFSQRTIVRTLTLYRSATRRRGSRSFDCSDIRHLLVWKMCDKENARREDFSLNIVFRQMSINVDRYLSIVIPRTVSRALLQVDGAAPNRCSIALCVMSHNSVRSISLISAMIRFVLIPGLPFGLNGCIAFFDFLARRAAADVAGGLASSALVGSSEVGHNSSIIRRSTRNIEASGRFGNRPYGETGQLISGSFHHLA